ncbi:STAS domain-containing protein [bacterium]|nr:STAS domain-containing protein [bacterium]
MKFNIKEKKSVVVITLVGDMVGGPDATLLSDKLRDLIGEGKNHILLDMQHVDYMNSSGLGILIAGVTTVRNSGGELKLFHLVKKLQNLLKITKLHRVFEIFENEDEAIDSFA